MMRGNTECGRMLRVAAYCRVSTDQDDQINSLDSQRRYFADYITRHGDWILSGVYYDEGMSGTQTRKRTGFNAMIEDAMRGHIDLILTKEVCRFARNTVDTLYFTRKLKERGIGVLFIIDNIDTRDSDGELRLTIMASIAQEESRKTSERVKWGQKRRMEQGVVFGRDLIGYTVRDGRLEINEAEVPVVRAIFHKYTNEGKGTHVIARELAEEGLRPKRVGYWSSTVILRVLRNEKYVGDLCQKKTFTPDYLTHAKKYNRGQEEQIYLRDHHEPIIDRELWNRTQNELARRSVSDGIKTKHSNRYWCSGKIFCGMCGHRYVSRTKQRKDGSMYRAWKCYASVKYGIRKATAPGEAIGCDSGSVNERALSACMKYCVRCLPMEWNEIKREVLQEIRTIEEVAERKPNANHIQEKIMEVNEKKKKAIDLMLDGDITRNELKEQIEWYDKQCARLSEMLYISRKCGWKYQGHESGGVDCENVVEAIFAFADVSQCLYREMLDHMIVYAGHGSFEKSVEVWLHGVPVGIKLGIHSHGRGGEYVTDISEVEIVERGE